MKDNIADDNILSLNNITKDQEVNSSIITEAGNNY